jgi:hypothetical protein
LTEARQIPQRPVHKRRGAVVAGAGLLLGLVGIFLWWLGQPPVPRFVHQGVRVYHRHGERNSVSVYSLTGEFQELVARARTELLGRGFQEENRGDDRSCVLVRGDYASRVRTIVAVKNYAFESATADSIAYRPRPGCISVEVQHIRRPLLEHLPVRWQYWYQRCFHPGKTIRLVERAPPGQPGQRGRPRIIRVIPPGTPLSPGGRRPPPIKDPNNR